MHRKDPSSKVGMKNNPKLALVETSHDGTIVPYWSAANLKTPYLLTVGSHVLATAKGLGIRVTMELTVLPLSISMSTKVRSQF